MAYKITAQTIEMPAGEYWVGDPCYAIEPHDRWIEWLEAADYTNNERILVADLDGHTVLGIGTAYGDGVYEDAEGRDYPVDAGLIGVTPVEVAVGNPSGMHRVNFDVPFECWYDDGKIHLGRITINTDPEDDEASGW